MRNIPAKIWIPVIVAMIAAVGLAIFFTWPREEKTPEAIAPEMTSTPEEEIPPEIPADWQTYRNEEYGFEVSYPGEGQMTDEGLINLPFTPGTLLLEKYLMIWVEETLSGQCSPLEAPEVREPEMIQFGNIEFTKQIGYEGAAGSVYETIEYSTVKDNQCFHLTFILRSANPGVFDIPPPDFDHEKETEIFEQIVSTFRFLK